MDLKDFKINSIQIFSCIRLNVFCTVQNAPTYYSQENMQTLFYPNKLQTNSNKENTK